MMKKIFSYLSLTDLSQAIQQKLLKNVAQGITGKIGQKILPKSHNNTSSVSLYSA